MTMSNNYWIKRFEQIENAQNKKALKTIMEIKSSYLRSIMGIDKEINSWLNRFAINNKISITEAKKWLNKEELKEFKWTVEDYIKYGKTGNPKWAKQLENVSAKVHISRLEALKISMQNEVENLIGETVHRTESLLADIYKDTYYRSTYELFKGIKIGFNVAELKDDYISKILIKPWSIDEFNFSQKLWINKTKLINTLDKELSVMVMTGESPQKTIARIKGTMQSSYRNTERLVMTEQAYFTSLAQNDTYKDLGIEEYEIVETLDKKTCAVCGDMDGKHFQINTMDIGANAPPFHPYCRGTTCPYFNDEFTTDGYRASRDANGDIVYDFPQNITYSEWITMNGGKNK